MLLTVLGAICIWFAGFPSVLAAGLTISSATISGSNLVVSGSGGVAGATYYVLGSTNLTLSPATSWNPISTNAFSANGQFTNDSLIDPSLTEEFLVVATKTPITFPGLVAAYSFNEGTGITVADLSGNGNNGTINGATWTTSGKYGDALVFNGTSALVTVSSSATLQLNTAMTLEAWVNPSVVTNSWRDVIYKGDDNYYLEGSSLSGGIPGFGGTFGTSDVVTYGVEAPAASTWAHLAATYDGTTMRLYVNGVQVDSQQQTGAIKTSTNPLQIGGDSLYGQFFKGMIDEVRVYKVALTAAQIQVDLNTPLGTIPTAPGSLIATAINPSQINLSWTASIGNPTVTGYSLERSQGASNTNFTQIATLATTTYSDTGLIANTNYNYRVRATNSLGNWGPYSGVASAFTGLAISPRVAALTVTRTQQFTASFSNVIWSVDGVDGGSVTSGTITSNGLYFPPGGAGTHSVTATYPDLSESASATVYITTNPGVYTYHNDNLRTGQNLNETVLTPANVNSNFFGKLFQYPLDGNAYASPVYVANVNVPGNGFHNLVFVATENDSVYAFDADGLTNNPVWQVNFTNPTAGITTIPAVDTGETFDIAGQIGITSTPVIDPVSGTIYVVAATKEISGNTTNYVQRLHALDIATGAEKFGSPVVIQGSVPGTGQGSSGGQVPFDPLHENQRPGLLLANGVVYFAFGSHGDVEPYYGWVMGYNATNVQQQTLIFNDAPNVNKAGIWMDGDGLGADSAGNLYFITGDGPFDGNTLGKDYGDCFMKLSTNGTVLDYFSPSVQTTLDQDNLDLGAGGGLLLPDQSGAHPHEMISAGKNGTIYLVDRDNGNMGHYNASNDQIVQELVNIFPNNLGIEGGSFCSPVYFNGRVYFGPVASTVQAFSLTNGLLSTSLTSQTTEVYQQRGATLSISANGSTNGILWTLQGNGSTTPGTLHAYDATNLGNELYNSDQAGSRDTLDVWKKFTIPVVVNGKVYVSSMTQLTVYGLLP